MAKTSRPRHSKQRREPVTIDLEADSVEREAGDQGQEPDERGNPEAKAESDSERQPETNPTDSGEQEAQPESEQAEGEEQAAPTGESSSSKADEAEDPGRSAEAEEDEVPSDSDYGGESKPSSPAREGRGSGRGLLAGVLGGVIALALGAGLQWANILPMPDDNGPDPAVENLRQELGSVQERLSQLSQAQPGNEVQAQISQLENRIAELGQTVSRVQSSAAQDGNGQASEALEQRISQIETRAENTVQAVEAARQTAAENAGRLDNLAEQISQLDARVAEQNRQPQLRLIVAAMALQSAVESGAPFASELETYTSLAQGDADVEPLRQYADQGLPGDAALARQASQVASRITGGTADVSQEDGLVGRLLAGARSAVQVRPVGQAEGNSASAVAARMESSVENGNYGQALKEYEALPPDAQKIAADLADRLRARQAADQIVQKALSSALQPA